MLANSQDQGRSQSQVAAIYIKSRFAHFRENRLLAEPLYFHYIYEIEFNNDIVAATAIYRYLQFVHFLERYLFAC